MKTEPESYSWDDLVKDKGTRWDGVRIYTARNNLKAMKKGELCLIYHSVGPKEIVGVAEVTRDAYADPTASADEVNKGWVAVDIKPKMKLARAITLAEVKAHKLLQHMDLVKQSRLSVCAVSSPQWDTVLELALARAGRITGQASPTREEPGK